MGNRKEQTNNRDERVMPTTLEQFMNSRRDLDQHRTGWDVLPDKEQDAEIRRRALNAGISASALADVFDAYTGNNGRRVPEFDLGDMDIWLEKQKQFRPHLFPEVGTYALAAAAFSENGVLNLAARSKLVLEVGEAQAEAMAKQWGLSSLTDWKTKGVRPDPADVSLNAEAQRLEAEIAQRQAKLDNIRKAAPKPEDSSNPFVRLADPAKREQALKHIESMVKAMGTAKVAAIAEAAGRRLDGSLIPAKFR